MTKMIVMLKRREGMTHAEFVKHYTNTHRPLLESIPETQRLVKGFVVSFPVAAPQ
ncbi:EthD domain-containing protein [Acidisoma silvae]|uniref:EthD domain-containing protein n=1 Tax=Acidisoma silvae TaxID=2802396 RepID=A0A963YW03_9PROT|nr:EthD domain-containing protein [Acidisoma silvae]MCB8878227.1 EthD domain-containing protein [Acidisoma silvae]